MIERLLALIGKIPTTQGQFCVAATLWLGTGWRYLISPMKVWGFEIPAWSPNYEWLGALLLLTGVSTAQFAVKRSTDIGLAQAKAGNVPTSAADAAVTS